LPRQTPTGTGQEDLGKAGGLAKPFYIKSAVATVVKRPLAQHTPELTSMVDPLLTICLLYSNYDTIPTVFPQAPYW
jgi:hypothetical protein